MRRGDAPAGPSGIFREQLTEQLYSGDAVSAAVMEFERDSGLIGCEPNSDANALAGADVERLDIGETGIRILIGMEPNDGIRQLFERLPCIAAIVANDAAAKQWLLQKNGGNTFAKLRLQQCTVDIGQHDDEHGVRRAVIAQHVVFEFGEWEWKGVRRRGHSGGSRSITSVLSVRAGEIHAERQSIAAGATDCSLEAQFFRNFLGELRGLLINDLQSHFVTVSDQLRSIHTFDHSRQCCDFAWGFGSEPIADAVLSASQ